MNHLGTQFIFTERLILRPFRRGDEYQMYRNFLSDPLVTKYTSWETYQNVDVARALLELHLINYARNPLTYYEWAVERNGEIIGSVDAFHIRDDTESCEVGCSIGSPYWSNGYASEALWTIICFLFEEVGFYRISASHHEKNEAAARLLKNIGVRYEGRLRGAFKNRDGTFSDVLTYGILRDDIDDIHGDFY